MILRDKFTIAMVAIVGLLLIAIAFFILYPLENINYPLSEEQKKKAEAIALNDSIIKDKLRGVQYKYYVQQGWTYDPKNPRFFVLGNITMGNVHEVSPGIDRIRYLPSVELIMGHKDLGDINVYIYVDLEKERAAYVGFASRSGPHATGYYYTPGEDGIVEHTEDTNWTRAYNNITIVDTGYFEGQELSDMERSSLFDLAKTNGTVKNFLHEAADKGESYELKINVPSHENELDGYYYTAVYPDMIIGTKLPDGSTGRVYLSLTLDGKKNKVLSVEKGEIFIPPPTPMPPYIGTLSAQA